MIDIKRAQCFALRAYLRPLNMLARLQAAPVIFYVNLNG